MRLPVSIIIIFCFAALFSLNDVDRNPSIKASFWSFDGLNTSQERLDWPLKPLEISGKHAEHLRIEIEPRGYALTGVLNFNYWGEGTDLVLLKIGQEARETRIKCPRLQKGKIGQCQTPVNLKSDSQLIFLVTGVGGGTSKIANTDFNFVSAKRTTDLKNDHLIWIFTCLVLIGPILVKLRKWVILQSILLISLGGFWLAYVSLVGAIIYILFLFVGYLFVAQLNVKKKKRSKKLLYFIGLLISGLAFFKFGVPFLAPAFANPGQLPIALPLGLSYLVIRLIDLCLCANSGTLKNLNLRTFIVFMLLPHTLLAGPIFTYEKFVMAQNEKYSVVDFSAGCARMMLGLGKKIFADAFLFPIVSSSVAIVATGSGELSAVTIWKMLLVNVLFVYLDFSAYCDLAIGAGRAGGIKIPENFNFPLLRPGIAAYWRNWHMTLSNWVMRRVYFPVFLSSRSKFLATLTSMLAIAVWHSPSLSWTTWAAHHGFALYLQNMTSERLAKNHFWSQIRNRSLTRYAVYVFGVIFVWFWVGLGHIFTLFSNFETALEVYSAAFGLKNL